MDPAEAEALARRAWVLSVDRLRNRIREVRAQRELIEGQARSEGQALSCGWEHGYSPACDRTGE